MTEDASVEEAGETMIERGFRHIPVVAGERAVGIVSIRDVAEWRLKNTPSEGCRSTGCRCRSGAGHCGMEIGDLVTYQGRAYVLRGLEPMSVPNRRVELEDPRAARYRRPLAEVSPQDR